MAHALTQQAVNMAITQILRALRGVPEECPQCGWPHLEPVGNGYEHATVTVINEKERRRKVLTYIASPNVIDESLAPYSWYKDFVLAGSAEHGLPAGYAEACIQSVEATEDPVKERDAKERAKLIVEIPSDPEP